jgi:hypothetical protein
VALSLYLNEKVLEKKGGREPGENEKTGAMNSWGPIRLRQQHSSSFLI